MKLLDIPGLVKEVRRSLDLTQEQLAHELGVTFSTVNAWENGRHRPIPALLAALRRLSAQPGNAGESVHAPSSSTGGGT
jgi:DNA-binding transcriptional regulator YiaG